MTSRPVSPWLYSILMIPFGAATGYASVTLGSLLTRGGVSVAEIAALGAMGTLPHTFKFLWSPVVDLTLTVKRWYIIALLLTAAGLATLGMWPAQRGSLAVLTAVVFLGSLASTVLGMAVDSFMAHCTAEERKGQAGGWSQAGNLGGAGIGGGLGLYLAMRVPEQWMASGTIALLCLLCCLPLLWIPSPARDIVGKTVGQLILATLHDTWRTVRVRRGMLALLLCFVPLGIGASSSLWSAIAPEWNVNEDTVALVTGVLGGLVCAAGSIAAGFICDRWHRQSAYVVFGLLVAAAGVTMALLPRTPAVFIVITLLFSFGTGLSWGGYSAFVLEAIGKGAAATKYNAFASLANAPIWYMGLTNGQTHKAWGTNGMLYFEAAMGVLGAVVFIIAAKVLLPARRERDAGAAAAD